MDSFLNLVVSTARRQTLSGRDARRPRPRVKPESDPFKQDIQLLSLLYFNPGITRSPEEKAQALADIGHLSWTGGPDAALYTGQKYFHIIVSILERDEPYVVQLQAVKCLSEVCKGMKPNQDLARSNSIIPRLIDMAVNGDDEMECWCLHALLFILYDNQENVQEAEKHPKLKKCLAASQTKNWAGWEHNEAKELISFLSMNFDESEDPI